MGENILDNGKNACLLRWEMEAYDGGLRKRVCKLLIAIFCLLRLVCVLGDCRNRERKHGQMPPVLWTAGDEPTNR